MRRRCADARHELRVWGDLDDVVDRLRALGPSGEPETVTDIYLVGPFPDANVEVRDEHLEVKRRLAERAGLGRWCPTWASSPPFRCVDVARLFGEPASQQEIRSVAIEGTDPDRLAEIRSALRSTGPTTSRSTSPSPPTGPSYDGAMARARATGGDPGPSGVHLAETAESVGR